LGQSTHFNPWSNNLQYTFQISVQKGAQTNTQKQQQQKNVNTPNT